VSEGDMYTLSVEGTLYGQLVVNTFGFIEEAGSSGFGGVQLINDFEAGCFTAYKALLPNACTITMMRARDVWPGTHAPAEEAFTTGNVGTSGPQAAPNQVAALISWRTDNAGRSYRGRSYFPSPPALESLGGGTLSSTHLAAMTAFRTAMSTVFGVGGTSSFTFAVISTVSAGAPRPAPIATPITSGLNRTITATQRRRRIGVGS
jgi:hypothetical protein